jgi:DNA-binding LacI/PurR family transcriptional regulator
VVVYNDNPILEVIKNGITAMSVDFGLMGEMAAAYVLNKKPVQKFLPTNVILRKYQYKSAF